MNGLKPLQGRVQEILVSVINVSKEKGISYSFETVLTAFLEVSLTKFAVQNQLARKDAEIREQMLSVSGQFDGRLCTNFFNLKKYKDDDFAYMASFLEKETNTLIEEHGYCVDDIGGIFESLYSMEFNEKELKETIDRSETGTYFSNPELVANTIDLLLKAVPNKNLVKSFFIDPAMGAGIFIFKLLDRVKARVSGQEFKRFIRNNVYGIDKNPIIVDIFKLCCWIKYSPYVDGLDFFQEHFQALDSLLLPRNGEYVAWEAVFPDVGNAGGFDFVIGNPPWGKIKANIREFNLLNGGLTKEFQGERLKKQVELEKNEYYKWDNYQKYIRQYAERLKKSGNFCHQQYVVNDAKTGGDFDLYKYFLELGYLLLKDGGKIAYIIPASFYMAEGTTGLRHLLLENGDIEYMLNFENKRHIFPIHSSFKFIVLIYSKKGRKGSIKRACFDLADVEDINRTNIKKRSFVSYSRNMLQLCSGKYWAVPECRSGTERTILEKMYKKYPVLGKKIKNRWKLSFVREFDMTLDSGKFVMASEKVPHKVYLPLYEGRMVHQYNSSRKCYQTGTGRTAVWKYNDAPSDRMVVPQYYVEKANCSADSARYRAVYCDVTGQKNVRTVLASLVPPEAVCGNKVPACKFFPDDGIEYHLFWIAIANSIVVDWLMRKKITTTLNFYHWNQIPFPRLEKGEASFNLLAAMAAVIIEKVNGCKIADEIQDDEISRIIEQNKCKDVSELRIEIDLEVAKLYDVDEREFACILYTFPSLDGRSVPAPGDMRYGGERKACYVTRDLLLFEMRKRAGKSNAVSVAEIYKEAGIDISAATGELKSLEERKKYYMDNGICAYNE